MVHSPCSALIIGQSPDVLLQPCQVSTWRAATCQSHNSICNLAMGGPIMHKQPCYMKLLQPPWMVTRQPGC